MSEENKDLARRSWQIVDNLDIIEEIYAPDVVWHEPDQEVHGIEEAKRFVTNYKTALPDLNVTVEDAIAEGDKAVTRWTVRGTHHGEGVTMHRIEDGKIVEEWEGYDILSILQQLGLVPDQEQASS
jgi:predicted ester cyclase